MSPCLGWPSSCTSPGCIGLRWGCVRKNSTHSLAQDFLVLRVPEIIWCCGNKLNLCLLEPLPLVNEGNVKDLKYWRSGTFQNSELSQRVKKGQTTLSLIPLQQGAVLREEWIFFQARSLYSKGQRTCFCSSQERRKGYVVIKDCKIILKTSHWSISITLDVFSMTTVCQKRVSWWDDADIIDPPGIFRHISGERMRTGDLWERKEDNVAMHRQNKLTCKHKNALRSALW